MADKNAGSVHRLSPMTIARVAFGVRYEPQFGVLSHVGEIVDSILRTEGSPFNAQVFPQTSTDVQGYALINPERNIALQINQQDTILHWNFNSRELDGLLSLADEFQTYVLVNLRKHASIRAVVRHGLLIRLEALPPGALKNPPIARYLASDGSSSNVTSLAMQFTRRLPVLEALAKKGVKDHRNVIYGVQESEEGKVQLSVDYQELFDPLLDGADWAKRPFGDFVSRGIAFFESDFTKWSKTFSGVSEVA